MSRFFVLGLMVVVFSRALTQQIPKTSFSCEGRTTGYYADVTTGCQVYHMCDGLGRKFSYMCPNATLFQQRMMICDHWFMVNCSRSEESYDANLLIGQRGIPFIDDATFSRTPRPDFLHPNEVDANIGYRKGKSQTQETKNLVGVVDEIPDSQAIDTNTDDPSYFPPSHWSTEYPSHSTTPNPGRYSDQRSPSKNQQSSRNQQFPRNQQSPSRSPQYDSRGPRFNEQPSSILPQKYYRTNYKTVNKSDARPEVSSNDANNNNRPVISDINKAKAIDFNSVNRNSNSFDSGIQKQTGKPFGIPPSKEQAVQVNFRSNFKATTPVYPTSVESTSVAPDDAGVLPPVKPIANVEDNSIVNFKSNFKATTPQFPTSVEVENFESNFKATTPQYPTSGEVVNFKSNFKATTPQFPTSVELVNFKSNFKATTPQYPTSVESTSPDPGEAGLLPPNAEAQNEVHDSANEANHIPEPHEIPIHTDIEPPKFDESYKNRGSTPTDTAPPTISEYFEPPKYDYEVAKSKASLESNNFRSPPDWSLTMKPEQWRDLRESFHIPDYDFPLDPATRPSYESDFNSFQSDGDKAVRK